jgi:hypothetical protein
VSEERETSPQAQAELDELAYSRADAIGKGVIVAGFPSAGAAQVFDVELREGELGLVHVGTVPVTPSPPA